MYDDSGIDGDKGTYTGGHSRKTKELKIDQM